MQTKNRALIDSLSERENQILELRKTGYSGTEISIKLGIARGTVHTYIERIRKKLLTTMEKIDENMI